MALDLDAERAVELMILKAIAKYDEKQEKRHQENLEKFDSLSDTISQGKGIKELLYWLIPVVVSIAMIIAEMVRK